jgi:very-short-patch-repair endonuclease
MLVVLAGLPEPQTQVPVLGSHGRVLYRLDMGWEEVKVALEYDGRHHIERQEKWHADLLRREDCESREWRFVVATSPDLYVGPHQTLGRVRTTLSDRGFVLPRLRDDWRVHFPSRETLTG